MTALRTVVSKVLAPTVMGATVILALVGALAGFLPARRASGIDPMVALRHE